MCEWCTKLAIGILLIPAKGAFAFTCEAVTSSTTVQPKAMTIQRDTPVGSLIAQVKSGIVTAYKCSNTSPPVDWQGRGVRGKGTYAGHFDGKRVYKTNVKGIGYAVGVAPFDECNMGQQVWVDAPSSVYQPDLRLYCNGGFLGPQMKAQAVIHFYKTESTTGTGTVSGKQVGAFVLGNNDAWQHPGSTISIGSFSVAAVSCSVGSKLILVDLGRVDVDAFSGPGTSPSRNWTKAFNIPLTCEKGASINLQLDGTAHDAEKGMLKLSSTPSSATGVAIQLLHNDKPVTLAKRFKWKIADADGDYTIPLKARYVQTSKSITPGVANGSATFTVTYQ